MMEYKYIDVHSHIHGREFDADRGEVLLRMQNEGIATIAIGTGLETSKAAISVAEKNEHVYATVGLHPVDDTEEPFNEADFRTLLAHPKVVGLGECGLDYHYIETFFEKEKVKNGWTHTKDAEADRQRELFERQITLAVEMGKPLMLHGRPSPKTMDAYEDMLYMLKNAATRYGDRLRGNFHFFVGNVEIAKQVLDIGFTMSFSGVITFAHDYDDVVRYVPLTTMHAETDSPYAAPVPFRGKRNEPTFVKEIYTYIATVRNEDEEKVRATLIQNAQRVFQIVM